MREGKEREREGERQIEGRSYIQKERGRKKKIQSEEKIRRRIEEMKVTERFSKRT